jgi:hypothetical protein
MDEVTKTIVKNGILTGIFIGFGLTILKKLHINIGI